MTDSLKKETIRGVFWSFMEKFGSRIIMLITQIILARLLTPADFGLIGILTIFITLSQVFVDSGFGNALIQKKNTSSVDYSTVFFCNIGVSIVLYVILFFTAPFIATFFNQLELIWLLRFVGLILIFDSWAVVPFAKFRKNIEFKTIAKATLFSNIASAFVGITLAYLNFGVWALAAQMVLIYLFRSMFFWIFSNWRPSLQFSKESFKELFNFGYKLLLSSLLDQIFQNIYLLIIGKLFSAKDLGYYTQAKNFSQVPVSTLYSVVGSVTFPTLSKLQDEPEKLLLALRKTIKLLAFVNFPLMLGLAVVAHPLFYYVLGEKWLLAVPYFQLLCLSGTLYTLHAINLSILQVKGRTDLFLKLELIKKGIGIVGIAIGLNWGIMGLVWSNVIVSFVAFFINSYYTNKLVHYPLFKQLKDLLPTLLASLIMVAVMLIVAKIYEMSIVLFLMQIIIGIVSYFTVAYLSKQEALTDGLKIIQEFIPVER
ncbi:lipopolysaccharide biosynthesis protein [Ancylomarina salipaludis]|uniref:Lipopolysaccharide biosynthesis protein n=1 Tax=Ancylomarina salipaludis TaxID=2501299 RepID=A0A4Q1JLQ9_9BACT|nr:lipopolysaccharide biosynthesis protein [Ancylomarina salipaludis]RXQ93869.1 lipopolysaccharide biosynthesis protein [Ancylomarina salipaludis]